MRKPAATVAVMLVMGCSTSKPDPASSRMQPGDRAVAVGEYRPEVELMVEEGLATLTTGTGLQCESDAEKPRETRPIDFPGKKADGPRVDGRYVRVLVLNGPHSGRIGRLYRYQLRPAAK